MTGIQSQAENFRLEDRKIISCDVKMVKFIWGMERQELTVELYSPKKINNRLFFSIRKSIIKSDGRTQIRNKKEATLNMQEDTPPRYFAKIGFTITPIES